jgi:non-ribosomal peptide synthetase-like protein
MQDVYQNPTVRQLAGVLTAPQPNAPGAPAEYSGDEVGPETRVRPPTTLEYVMCGAIQLAVFVCYTMYSAWLLVLGFDWTTGASGVVDMWWRSAGYGAAMFLVLSLTPVLVKWMLVGRWKPGRIRIWSLGYVRFWIVKTLTRINPLVLFAGSPLYVLYLRLLGAKIGKGVVIMSRMVPVCTDLLTIGDNTVIHKNSFFLCSRARSGIIEKGPVTLGKNVLVSEKTTLDIGTSMGDDTQLGHASSLQTLQTIPVGQTWHGSPARPTTANYRRVPGASCTTRRRVVFSLFQLFGRFFLVLPGGILVLAALLPSYLDTGHLNPGNPSFFLEVMAVTLVLYMARFLGGLFLILSVPRILNLFLKPDKVYPLYGIHFSLQRLIARITTFKLYKDTFGDSSYIVNYLSALGYDLGKVEQTGSNFGAGGGPGVALPEYSVGTGTMVSDGLNMMNADFSSTSFRLSRVRDRQRGTSWATT